MTELDVQQCVRLIITEMAELTGRPTPSPASTFVDAVGDSFAAIMLTAAIEEHFTVLIDILDVSQAASLTALGELVVSRHAGAALR